LYYLAPKCLYRGEYKWMRPRVLSPCRWWWLCKNCVLFVSWIPDVVLNVLFYSSKGRPRLQSVGIRISLDRGIALAYSRLPYRRGLESSCYGVLW